jgi:hypothetical protein
VDDRYHAPRPRDAHHQSLRGNHLDIVSLIRASCRERMGLLL